MRLKIERSGSPLILWIILALAGCSTNPRVTVADMAIGFDQAKLAKLIGDTANTRKNLHSLIIERRGQVVAELYRDGWNTSLSDGGGILNHWSKMGPETLHDVRSTTKSIVALVAGSVLARHPEYSVRSRIRDFPDLAEKAPQWAQDLELRDFLTMSSGLAWKEWGRGTFTSDETPLAWKKDPVGYSLKRPQKTAPGTVFNYSGGSTFVVSRMLELIDGRPIAEIVASDLFEPLDITSWKWGAGWNGYHLPNSGIGLRSKDMLKIGELTLSRGSWDGRQIIPAAWIDEMTAPHIKVQTNLFDLDDQGTTYGYFWWNGTIDLSGAKARWYSTVGNGGQKIFVVPNLELVVIMTGGDYGSADMQIWETDLLKGILASALPQ